MHQPPAATLTVSVMTRTVSVAVVLANEMLAGALAQWALARLVHAELALLVATCAEVALSTVSVVTMMP